MRIYTGVATTSLFRIDVPSSSQGIRLGSEFPRTETNDEVEGRKEFGPSGLPTGEEFGGREIFQVLVVSDDVDRTWSSFEVVSPSPKCFEDG